MTSQGMYSIVVGGSWNKVFVLCTALGFQDSDEDEDEDDHEE